MEQGSWDQWVEDALTKLESLKVLRSLRPIYLSTEQQSRSQEPRANDEEYQVFDEMQAWDRSSVEVSISEPTFQRWLHDIPSSGNFLLCIPFVLLTNATYRVLVYFVLFTASSLSLFRFFVKLVSFFFFFGEKEHCF